MMGSYLMVQERLEPQLSVIIALSNKRKPIIAHSCHQRFPKEHVYIYLVLFNIAFTYLEHLLGVQFVTPHNLFIFISTSKYSYHFIDNQFSMCLIPTRIHDFHFIHNIEGSLLVTILKSGIIHLSFCLICPIELELFFFTFFVLRLEHSQIALGVSSHGRMLFECIFLIHLYAKYCLRWIEVVLFCCCASAHNLREFCLAGHDLAFHKHLLIFLSLAIRATFRTSRPLGEVFQIGNFPV